MAGLRQLFFLVAGRAGLALGYLHIFVAGDTEFFVEIVLVAFQVYELDIQGATLRIFVALGAVAQFFLMLGVREDNRCFFAFDVMLGLQIDFRRAVIGPDCHEGKNQHDNGKQQSRY